MTSAAQTRRALLGAGIGAVAATVATAVARPAQVLAEGQAVLVGGEYTDATSQTLIQNQTNTNSVFVAHAASGGTGLVGEAEGGGTGIAGTSSGSGSGVYANSITGYAIDASTSLGPACIRAIQSYSGPQGGPAILANHIWAGVAIEAYGLLKLSTSGVAIIPANKTLVTVNPGVDITAGSFLLLTPKTNIGPRSLYFTTNTIADTFAIKISKARTTATTISWLLLNQY